MGNWRHSIPIDVVDCSARGRVAEPVEVGLTFTAFQPVGGGVAILDEAGRPVLTQIVMADEDEAGQLRSATICFIADVAPRAGRARYTVLLGDGPATDPEATGIRQLPTQLADGFRRLDTGAYEIELCRGTGGGGGGSKWGIRHFEHKDQGINLIHGNKNAFGGVYGPFFTPENGLVNPPAHMVIDVEPIAEGPVLCRYRMRGMVPDGLLPELRGKTIEIWWSFWHRSPWFVRSYFVDDYETTIDGRPVSNRITVGDEIESGKGNLLLSSYRHYEGTRYRAGDLYHALLLERIHDLRNRNPDVLRTAAAKLGIDPDEDPASWHWDNYWRIFCVIEGALPEDVLRAEAEGIWRSANKVVWSDAGHAKVHYSDDFIDVSRMPQESIFPLDARKTCDFGADTGYSFVRYVNRTVPRMDIIHRRESGWVNWGTNGENEYPEMPTGSTIWSAYGAFTDWRHTADCMEQPLALSVGAMERR